VQIIHCNISKLFGAASFKTKFFFEYFVNFP